MNEQVTEQTEEQTNPSKIDVITPGEATRKNLNKILKGYEVMQGFTVGVQDIRTMRNIEYNVAVTLFSSDFNDKRFNQTIDEGPLVYTMVRTS